MPFWFLTDVEPPDIDCPTNIVTTNTPVFWANPTATDNVDNNLLVTCNPSSPFDSGVGTHTVTCTAVDDANNMATCTFTITIEERGIFKFRIQTYEVCLNVPCRNDL